MVSADGFVTRPRRNSGYRTQGPVRGDLTDLLLIRRARSAHGRAGALIGALVVLAAAAIVASSSGLGPSVSLWTDPNVPAGTEAPPLFPFYLVGHTFDDEGDILGGCTINITDLTTGASNNTTVSDPVTGFYICDINNGLTGGVAVGHVIKATAYFGNARGSNQTLLRDPLGSYTQVNLTVLGEINIPEFGSALLPMAGMFGIVAAVCAGVRRKNGQQ